MTKKVGGSIVRNVNQIKSNESRGADNSSSVRIQRSEKKCLSETLIAKRNWRKIKDLRSTAIYNGKT